jgi:hypothetical protein
LFESYITTDGITHHRHAEYVAGMDGRVRVLAESTANGRIMPYVLELKDANKHIIGFQNHPERNSWYNLREGEQPHFGGLVLLVSALNLLPVRS